MSYVPRWIYKDGKLSTRPADGVLVKSIAELLEKTEEGFLPLGCESIDKLAEIPEFHRELNVFVNKQKTDDKVEKIAEKVTEYHPESEGVCPQTDKEKFEKETGKKAYIDRGPYKGDETKAFKKYKEKK